MEQDLVFGTILGMTLVTYIPRLLPVIFLSAKRLPKFLETWLSHIPAAVLAALVAPTLLVDQQHVNLASSNLFLWASVPTAWIAWKTKNLFLSVLLGMTIVALARLILLP
jgi:branched-subunit amino acid transport protein